MNSPVPSTPADSSKPAGSNTPAGPAASADSSTPVNVVMAGITKSFGSVVACDNVSLTLHQGRIHGILGENGAGKSTLMKILCGLYLPDAGSIKIAGSQCRLQSPNDARQLGIAMVHQHFSLVPALKVWENVLLGDTGPLREKKARQRIAEVSQYYGLDINPDDKVETLPVGIRQRVEIIKCLVHDPRIIILDEPTSVLSPAESESLFGVLRQVVGEGNHCVALVSHKLNEILTATDDITIMRQGKIAAQMPTSQASAGELAEAMVGRKVNLPLALPQDRAYQTETNLSSRPPASNPIRSRPPARNSSARQPFCPCPELSTSPGCGRQRGRAVGLLEF